VVESDRAAAALERAPEEDSAATTHVEQRVVRRQLQRVEHRVPGERVRVVRTVRLTRRAAVRAPGDAVRHAIDPPVADAMKHVQPIAR